jgi:hypothetical protein
VSECAGDVFVTLSTVAVVVFAVSKSTEAAMRASMYLTRMATPTESTSMKKMLLTITLRDSLPIAM